MNKIFSVLAIILMLSACTTQLEKAVPCSGSLVKGCMPVVYFDYDSARLKKDQQDTLDKWALLKLERFSNKYVYIVGHADKKGTPEYNMNLSKKRAKAVQDFFIKKGIDPKRITIGYFGNSDLLTEEDDYQDLNRRVEVYMTFPHDIHFF